MEQNKLMEGLNESQVLEGMSNSKGGMIVKLAVVAAGVIAGIGAVTLLRKRKAKKKTEAEFVESDVEYVEDNE